MYKTFFLCSWCLVEFNTRSYWMIYGHVATAKSKCRSVDDNQKTLSPALPTNQRLFCLDIILSYIFMFIGIKAPKIHSWPKRRLLNAKLERWKRRSVKNFQWIEIYWKFGGVGYWRESACQKWLELPASESYGSALKCRVIIINQFFRFYVQCN